MAENIRNIAASVHSRLLNKARASGRPFNELLQHFAIERFIYRLPKSHYADKFILKGALMFAAWRGHGSRPTMDIDLLGKIANDLEVIISAMREACETEVEADGISFDAVSVQATRIAEDALYEGVRVRLKGHLGNARVSLQVDIGFGDVIVPGPQSISYPTLLDFPAPELQGYTIESTVAEKFQAMVKLGILNSRMKDFYDIWMLSRQFDFKGELLARAVQTTFESRSTLIPATPIVFDPAYMKDQEKQAQWRGFVRKSKLSDAPASFEGVVAAIRTFLGPFVSSLAETNEFHETWKAPGPRR